jgi:hypothetical protein
VLPQGLRFLWLLSSTCIKLRKPATGSPLANVKKPLLFYNRFLLDKKLIGPYVKRSIVKENMVNEMSDEGKATLKLLVRMVLKELL